MGYRWWALAAVVLAAINRRRPSLILFHCCIVQSTSDLGFWIHAVFVAWHGGHVRCVESLFPWPNVVDKMIQKAEKWFCKLNFFIGITSSLLQQTQLPMSDGRNCRLVDRLVWSFQPKKPFWIDWKSPERFTLQTCQVLFSKVWNEFVCVFFCVRTFFCLKAICMAEKWSNMAIQLYESNLQKRVNPWNSSWTCWPTIGHKRFYTFRTCAVALFKRCSRTDTRLVLGERGHLKKRAFFGVFPSNKVPFFVLIRPSKPFIIFSSFRFCFVFPLF